MLKQLYIKNFALIDHLDIKLDEGFSVITGETGAGKSIILGAITLLTGGRADLKAIKPGADKCVIEAHFDLTNYDAGSFFDDNEIDIDLEDTIIRRELTSSGKSRAFVNDCPVSISVLKELGEQLIDIHSQHKNLLLGKQDFQLEVIDIIAKDNALLSDYRAEYSKMKALSKELEAKEQQIESEKNNVDFIRFQFNELEDARLQAGEQDELERQSEMMTHAEDIKSALYQADNKLNDDNSGAIVQLRSAIDSLRSIASLQPEYQDLADRLNANYIDIKDIASDIDRLTGNVDYEPAELERINLRLDLLYQLQKKHRVGSVEELIEKRNSMAETLNNVDNSEEVLAELREALAKQRAACEAKSSKLTASRKKSAAVIEKEIAQRLTELGMPSIRFEIAFADTELTSNGANKVDFLFSANKNMPPQSIASVASGGEIARVMLSIKALISNAVKLPTIIFDEIDTGVSGAMAEKMGNIMKEMGDTGRQVISITHLPQIAAKGKAHFVVSKTETETGTSSEMKRLTREERITAIASMLSGSDITEAAISNAKTLLSENS